MLTKITTALLLLALVAMGWMAASHRDSVDSLERQVATANASAAASDAAKAEAVGRAEAAERANMANRSAIASLTAEVGIQRLLAEQEKERSRSIQARYDELTDRFQEALQNDPAARDWATVPLPDAVASGRLLYHPRAQGGDRGGDADRGDPPAGYRPVPADGAGPPVEW